MLGSCEYPNQLGWRELRGGRLNNPGSREVVAGVTVNAIRFALAIHRLVSARTPAPSGNALALVRFVPLPLRGPAFAIFVCAAPISCHVGIAFGEGAVRHAFSGRSAIALINSASCAWRSCVISSSAVHIS